MNDELIAAAKDKNYLAFSRILKEEMRSKMRNHEVVVKHLKDVERFKELKADFNKIVSRG